MYSFHTPLNKYEIIGISIVALLLFILMSAVVYFLRKFCFKKKKPSIYGSVDQGIEVIDDDYGTFTVEAQIEYVKSDENANTDNGIPGDNGREILTPLPSPNVKELDDRKDVQPSTSTNKKITGSKLKSSIIKHKGNLPKDAGDAQVITSAKEELHDEKQKKVVIKKPEIESKENSNAQVSENGNYEKFSKPLLKKSSDDLASWQDSAMLFTTKSTKVFGSLHIAFEYLSDKNSLQLTLNNGKHLPVMEARHFDKSRINITLLPKKQSRYHTTILKGQNPIIDQSFKFKVTSEDFRDAGIRFRLYQWKRFKRVKMLAENTLSLYDIDKNNRSERVLDLIEPSSELGSTSSLDTIEGEKSPDQKGLPELLLSMSYNKKIKEFAIHVKEMYNIQKSENLCLTCSLTNLDETLDEKQPFELTDIGLQELLEKPFTFKVKSRDLSIMITKITLINEAASDDRIVGCIILGDPRKSSELENKNWYDFLKKEGKLMERWYKLNKL